MSTTADTARTPLHHRRAVVLPLLFLAQLALLVGGVAPQLSARLTGTDILLRVEPVDPIDPFRGAYVALGYPDLRRNDSLEPGMAGLGSMDDRRSGTLYLRLERDGDTWKAADWSRERPEDGTYLRCDDRDWQIRCGIESFFVPQDEAQRLQDEVGEGGMVAVVRVDDRGNAAVTDLRPLD